jgi:hypothetical protein
MIGRAAVVAMASMIESARKATAAPVERRPVDFSAAHWHRHKPKRRRHCSVVTHDTKGVAMLCRKPAAYSVCITNAGTHDVCEECASRIRAIGA